MREHASTCGQCCETPSSGDGGRRRPSTVAAADPPGIRPKGRGRLKGEHDERREETLYERLGGYGAIAAVANDLLPGSRPIRSSAASGTSRRGTASSVKATPDRFPLRERGRPMYYRAGTWRCATEACASAKRLECVLGHVAATLANFQVPESERRDVVALFRASRKRSSNKRRSNPLRAPNGDTVASESEALRHGMRPLIERRTFSA